MLQSNFFSGSFPNYCQPHACLVAEVLPLVLALLALLLEVLEALQLLLLPPLRVLPLTLLLLLARRARLRPTAEKKITW